MYSAPGGPHITPSDFAHCQSCRGDPPGPIDHTTRRRDRRAALTLVKVEPVLLEPIETISKRWVGSAVARKEDQALLTGQARFIDDLSPIPGIRFAAILRSPHPHARIGRIDLARARDLPGVRGIVTGKDVSDLIGPVPSVVKAPLAYYPIAIDRVRYVGEPVAVVIADTRYIAEDACDLIGVEYEVLPAASDLRSATARDAPVIHERVGSNIISRRSFSYGNPDAAFAVADRVFEFSYSYPRYASTPMETFGVIAQFERAPDRYTVWSNFQGPFVVQPLMASALRVPGHRLRLFSPPSAARRACPSSGSKIAPSTSRPRPPRAIAWERSRRRSRRTASSLDCG